MVGKPEAIPGRTKCARKSARLKKSVESGSWELVGKTIRGMLRHFR
jgi:hypothetical protein